MVTTAVTTARRPKRSNGATPAGRFNGTADRELPLGHFPYGRAQFVPLNVDQYHRMIETGILPEGKPIHLLDGVLVRKDRSKAGEDPMTVGLDHSAGITRLVDVAPKFRRFGCYLRVQLPVTLPPDNEPEPDGAVIRGKIEDYLDHQPGPRDVLCAIEVADSSLRQYRTTMQRIYADHAIPQYIIVNLIERVVEVYTRPLVGQGRYALVTILGPRQRVEINTGGRRRWPCRPGRCCRRAPLGAGECPPS